MLKNGDFPRPEFTVCTPVSYMARISTSSAALLPHFMHVYLLSSALLPRRPVMVMMMMAVQVLVSHTYRCSPCLQPTTVNKIVTSDVSTSLEIISNYIETVVPCLACMPHFITAHKLPYDDEVKSSH